MNCCYNSLSSGYTLSLLLLLQFLFSACDNSAPPPEYFQHSIANGEYIYRKHDEFHFNLQAPESTPLPAYPWRNSSVGGFSAITKYHFRCKGSTRNPPKKIEQNGEMRYIIDCNGPSAHSLILKDCQEHIYPILIDLLNYVQSKALRKVVITSGHRCPEHHLYVDNSKAQMYSKHMIGAEVDFYLEGLEEEPDIAIALLQDYFQNHSTYQGQKEYQHFERWDKASSDLSTPPWYNKEIFIKLYKKHEGRNVDNSHNHPYIGVQVRYDREKCERVIYSWDKAFRSFYRH